MLKEKSLGKVNFNPILDSNVVLDYDSMDMIMSKENRLIYLNKNKSKTQPLLGMSNNHQKMKIKVCMSSHNLDHDDKLKKATFFNSNYDIKLNNNIRANTFTTMSVISIIILFIITTRYQISIVNFSKTSNKDMKNSVFLESDNPITSEIFQLALKLFNPVALYKGISYFEESNFNIEMRFFDNNHTTLLSNNNNTISSISNLEKKFINNYNSMNLSPKQIEIVMKAANVWTQIILDDLPDEDLTEYHFCPYNINIKKENQNKYKNKKIKCK